MPSSLHPLDATQRIRDDYARYLRTIYFFNDPRLREQFWQALAAPDFLVKGPILEAAPPFKTGRSIEGLVAAGVLHSGFRALCCDNPALPWDRPLYLHQDQAIEQVVRHDRNVVVATGTGSGKTESFLLPIFDHLLRQREAGLLRQPGVRALLLYPMNALANDQLKRLRSLLKDFPDITFGRYTGETLQGHKQAEDHFREQTGGEMPLPNELLSRDQMQVEPPHILITNYAMLEYLLLRPKDTAFFDGATGSFWRFIALDEAHIYDGAAGIEIAMLLRRLKDRVVQSEPGRLRCIATSATIGRGREDFPAVARFAQALFGEPFAWDEADPLRQDVVEGQRVDMAELSTTWGDAPPALYISLAEGIGQGEDVPALAARARAAGAPLPLVTEAARSAPGGDQGINHFLYEVLRGDSRLHRLRDALREPRLLTDLPGVLGGPGNTAESLVRLVELAVRARPAGEALSLLPARYHVFARALEGAFICLNQAHPAHANECQRWLFLNRYERCPHCRSAVFELATCPRCGTAYLVGREETASEGGVRSRAFRQAKMTTTDEEMPGLLYLTLDRLELRTDEDETLLEGTDPDMAAPAAPEAVTLCLGCGSLGRHGEPPRCLCPPTTRRVTLHAVPTEDDRLTHCVGCGARNKNGVVFRFLTGQDAPVSVLATSLYQMLPPDKDRRAARLPGQGRKLLTFADSRQDAAFFASYLQNTYESLLHRRLILQALNEDEAGRDGRLRLQDLAKRLQRVAEQAGLFSSQHSFDEQSLTVQRWLMEELIALDSRQALEGMGLLHFRLVRPPDWVPPAPLLAAPWSFTPDEAWTLLVILLDTLRRQGAVTFPPNVDPRNPAFEPRNVEIFVAETSNTQAKALGWLPKRGSNRRLDYLTRLLIRRTGLTAAEAEPVALDTLRGLWKHLTERDTAWRTHLAPERQNGNVVYRLNFRQYEWAPIQGQAPLYRCSRCFGIAYAYLDGVCPQNSCQGTLQALDPAALARLDNHYRHLYLSLEPFPLLAEEHTAQWTPDKGGEIQNRFVGGEINVLSCSTTFELGVDVGELQAVLLRNVPPTTANYVQRAGRAGRRTDSVAFVLTYAQRRSHDLTHYARPTSMVAGRVTPPVVHVSNEKIVRRHLHSVVLAVFFRWANDRHGRVFGNVSDFFAPETGQLDGPHLLEDFLCQRPPALQDALRRVTPPDLRDELGVETWGWTERLMNDAGNGILDRAMYEVTTELALYQQLEAEASAAKRYQQASHFQRVAATLRKRPLLGFLGSRNVLPEYGFPTNVVELRTGHIPIPQAEAVRLSRDLRIAIAEYAPGAQVVAAKHIWTSVGIYPLRDRHWPSYRYAICRRCHLFHRHPEQTPTRCQCGAPLNAPTVTYGAYIKPEFGFVAGRDPQPARESRPHRLYSSRAYFWEYGPALYTEEELPLAEVPELMSDSIHVARKYSRYGNLVVVNSGMQNNGFSICTYCGWGEPAVQVASGRRRSRKAHDNPRTGRACPGQVQPFHLGHEFMTDVLEVRFMGTGADPYDMPLWLSLLYAALEGASQTLNIARDDLDGTLYAFGAGEAPALVLFDNVPGGAGHVRRVADYLPQVLRAAWERVAGCHCGEETSCYECLRNFYNQFAHDQLRRGCARDFLAVILA